MAYHVPVLLTESIDGLNIKPSGTYVDLTFGGGGHSKLILEHLNRHGRLFAFDQDEDALKNALDDKRFKLIRGNFMYFRNFLRYEGVQQVDGILADLGVSSYHFDSPERGFSFRFEGPLDMRMNRNSKLTAAKVINEYEPDALTSILKLYGELPDAKRFTTKICQNRETHKVEKIEELAELLLPMIPQKIQNKTLAKVFQALRIEVNHELEALKAMLMGASKQLEPEGRLVIISYHSLEDRLVKNFIKFGNFEGTNTTDLQGNRNVIFEQVNRKVISPSDDEIKENSRARSAKLRIASKL